MCAALDIGLPAIVDLVVSLPSLAALYLYLLDGRVLGALFWRSYAVGFVAWELSHNLWLVPSLTGEPLRAADLIAAAFLLPPFFAPFHYAFQDWHAHQ